MFPFYTPLKTPKNQRFSGVFRGYKKGTLARNGLRSKRNTMRSSEAEGIDKLYDRRILGTN